MQRFKGKLCTVNANTELKLCKIKVNNVEWIALIEQMATYECF